MKNRYRWKAVLFSWGKTFQQHGAEPAAWRFLFAFVSLIIFAIALGVDVTRPFVAITISGFSLAVMITALWPSEK